MGRVTLLIVDDDADLLCILRRRLERDGYEVIAAESGKQALQALDKCLPDLALVDLLMPEMDGFALAEAIKRRGDLPIIFLSSVGDARARTEGIRRYAEDYLVKPYDYAELLARVQRVLRRTAGTAPLPSPQVVVDRDLSLDLALGVACTPAGTVRLSPIEVKLLYHLVRHAGQTLSVGTLVARMWDYGDESGPEALRVAIYRLRRKLEPDPTCPRYILTVRDAGYRFVELKPP
jgi:DNA-binding response OmpR family regulator